VNELCPLVVAFLWGKARGGWLFTVLLDSAFAGALPRHRRYSPPFPRPALNA
jgi:hypothetical protein